MHDITNTADGGLSLDEARRGLMNFVREYSLSDIGICDRLINLFKAARKLGLTSPGLTGNREVNKKVKDSEEPEILAAARALFFKGVEQLTRKPEAAN